jgi:hypothetical protein
MNPEELKKLDQIPTSDKPWYLQAPFLGVAIIALLFIFKFLLSLLATV